MLLRNSWESDDKIVPRKPWPLVSLAFVLVLILALRLFYLQGFQYSHYHSMFDDIRIKRRVIEATGCEIVEMPRHGDRAFCCSAGGGRIWMEEGEIEIRPSEARINEAAALDDVGVFIVACPKDITMFRDAVKTAGQEGNLVVMDLIDLVHEALELDKVTVEDDVEEDVDEEEVS